MPWLPLLPLWAGMHTKGAAGRETIAGSACSFGIQSGDGPGMTNAAQRPKEFVTRRPEGSDDKFVPSSLFLIFFPVLFAYIFSFSIQLAKREF